MCRPGGHAQTGSMEWTRLMECAIVLPPGTDSYLLAVPATLSRKQIQQPQQHMQATITPIDSKTISPSSMFLAEMLGPSKYHSRHVRPTSESSRPPAAGTGQWRTSDRLDSSNGSLVSSSLCKHITRLRLEIGRKLWTGRHVRLVPPAGRPPAGTGPRTKSHRLDNSNSLLDSSSLYKHTTGLKLEISRKL